MAQKIREISYFELIENQVSVAISYNCLQMRRDLSFRARQDYQTSLTPTLAVCLCEDNMS